VSSSFVQVPIKRYFETVPFAPFLNPIRLRLGSEDGSDLNKFKNLPEIPCEIAETSSAGLIAACLARRSLTRVRRSVDKGLSGCFESSAVFRRPRLLCMGSSCTGDCVVSLPKKRFFVEHALLRVLI